MASPMPMKHIERKDLYTNLEARIQYLHSFLTSQAYDITARAFTGKNTTQGGEVGEMLHEDSPQIMHRKMFLRAHLNKLCSDPSKVEFWEYLDEVGIASMTHVGLGRRHPLHIEYVHLGACLGFIQDVLTEAILSHPRLHMYRMIALVKALNKVIWIQNDFMARWHVREADGFGLLESDVSIEKEGYLHGRQILDDKLMADANTRLPATPNVELPQS
ncbi:uncharacterized protein MAM_08025 [Metarhizium album ARSEF 1941]|uniref:Globin-sensor domain-containing protein n=1 Tax=Metarhizium album (strain ARSEF 1941) TaxID=1081103 RepID=A0A0B2WM52_METAS|nr:uncharacterized protein MAM_08025 [Metarhizium album ARSEF 1941]KHN94095.1 hypothetical protein MAM_08025 [Metarhizium album ARSEF 1941]